MMTPYLNMKPGQRRRSTDRVNSALQTIIQDEGALNDEFSNTYPPITQR